MMTVPGVGLSLNSTALGHASSPGEDGQLLPPWPCLSTAFTFCSLHFKNWIRFPLNSTECSFFQETQGEGWLLTGQSVKQDLDLRTFLSCVLWGSTSAFPSGLPDSAQRQGPAAPAGREKLRVPFLAAALTRVRAGAGAEALRSIGSILAWSGNACRTHPSAGTWTVPVLSRRAAVGRRNLRKGRPPFSSFGAQETTKAARGPQDQAGSSSPARQPAVSLRCLRPAELNGRAPPPVRASAAGLPAWTPPTLTLTNPTHIQRHVTHTQRRPTHTHTTLDTCSHRQHLASGSPSVL